MYNTYVQTHQTTVSGEDYIQRKHKELLQNLEKVKRSTRICTYCIQAMNILSYYITESITLSS